VGDVGVIAVVRVWVENSSEEAAVGVERVRARADMGEEVTV
jgi:hypothetical protein